MSIIPGCMRNFDAATSDWCFPEGYSFVGITHWNKFHASVLVAARLMRRVGGYDPAIPWGLEDWNFWCGVEPEAAIRHGHRHSRRCCPWPSEPPLHCTSASLTPRRLPFCPCCLFPLLRLHASVHQPRVRFIPEATFWYRQHAGTSMRKAMFASHLEETKAMVRTNHGAVFEPLHLLRDHEIIAAMARAAQGRPRHPSAFASLLHGSLFTLHSLPFRARSRVYLFPCTVPSYLSIFRNEYNLLSDIFFIHPPPPRRTCPAALLQFLLFLSIRRRRRRFRS